jgi:hypothetical protein
VALVSTTDWPDSYPPEALRAETDAMAAAWAEVLRARLGDAAIRGIYLKGSAVKPWDSPVDYVPTVSDVDIHLWLAAADDRSKLDDLPAALEIAEAVRGAYLRRIARPLHLPKPQLTLVNTLHELPGYVPSPASTVRTLFGERYQAAALDAVGEAQQRERDRESLLAHREFLAAAPMRIIDRPVSYLGRILDELPWRVSPVAPRVLSLAGGGYDEVWTPNRTALVGMLRTRGFAPLAEAYEQYYLGAWRVVLGESGPEGAVRAGLEALRLGIEVAEG